MFGLLYAAAMTATTPTSQPSVLAHILIRAERDRQIYVEGFTPESDLEKGHTHAGNLLRAAIAYRTYSSEMWPWAGTFKPKDPIRNLVRAGALVLAAIEVAEAAEEPNDFQIEQMHRALEMTVAQLGECIDSLQAMADQVGWDVVLNDHRVVATEPKPGTLLGKLMADQAANSTLGDEQVTVHEDAEAFIAHLDKLSGQDQTPHDKKLHLDSCTYHDGQPALATKVPGCPVCDAGRPMSGEEISTLWQEQHG